MQGDDWARRVDLHEIARKIDRIYIALFEEVAGTPGLFTRVRILEQKADDDAAEKKEHRILAAAATLVGSAIGAAAAYFSGHK
jgi:hypothetical protein